MGPKTSKNLKEVRDYWQEHSKYLKEQIPKIIKEKLDLLCFDELRNTIQYNPFQNVRDWVFDVALGGELNEIIYKDKDNYEQHLTLYKEGNEGWEFCQPTEIRNLVEDAVESWLLSHGASMFTASGYNGNEAFSRTRVYTKRQTERHPTGKSVKHQGIAISYIILEENQIPAIRRQI